MAMTILSAILGLLSPIVFIIGAMPFSVHGTVPLKAALAGSVTLALYLALFQFLVARNAHSAGRTRAVWSSNFVAMIAAVPILFLYNLVSGWGPPAWLLSKASPCYSRAAPVALPERSPHDGRRAGRAVTERTSGPHAGSRCE